MEKGSKRLNVGKKLNDKSANCWGKESTDISMVCKLMDGFSFRL